MSNTSNKINNQSSPKDGLDNTGTQGYDSLSDDAFTGKIKPVELPENDLTNQIPVTIKSSEIKGEKIIFDLLINEKLAHVIVIKDGSSYHINLNGEDVGHFEKNEDETIERFPQPKAASNDVEAYFKPIEAKLKVLNK